MKTILFIVLLTVATTCSAKKTIVCYFEGWALDRSGEGKYTYKNIDVEKCTHVAYAFAGLTSTGEIKKPNNIADLSKFTSYIKKRGAKAILSVGGASEGTKRFSNVVQDASARSRFVKNAVSLLEKYGFDGLDVDWEYPNQGSGSRKADKQNFVELLKGLKQAFAKNGYALSAAVAADPDSIAKSYLIAQIARYLDFINVMAYDFNGSWDSHTGMNAPLYASHKDDSYQRTLNVNASIHYWLSHGAPAKKIIVGVPFYGRTFMLKNANNHGLHAASSGPGKAAKYTSEDGLIGYNELCLLLKNGGWKVVRDKEQRVPYAYKGKEWITYDDVESIKEKMQFVKSLKLGGAMIWSVDTDDFNGLCGRKTPLLNAVNEGLRSCKNITRLRQKGISW